MAAAATRRLIIGILATGYRRWPARCDRQLQFAQGIDFQSACRRGGLRAHCLRGVKPLYEPESGATGQPSRRSSGPSVCHPAP